MNRNFHLSRVVLAAGLCAGVLLHPGGAYAVNGTSLSGIGVKSAGMGGASIALPQDSAAAGNNPAGMGLVGSRADLGIQVLHPSIDYQFGSSTNTLHSGGIAPVPEGGFNLQVDSRMTLGVSLFSVGVAADYGRPALPVQGADSAKSALQAVIAAPTLTYKLDEQNILGVSVALAYQRFRAQGVIVPTANGPAAVPSHGTQSSFGQGIRFGYLWQPTSTFAFGAFYATRIRMGKLEGYDKDLLASSDGRIDVAPRYGIGLSYKPTPAVALAFDWLHISWSKTILGSPQGFSWKDQDVFRLGAAYDIDSQWTARVGYTRSTASFPSDAVAQNFLSPLPNAKAVTGGLTYRINAVHEISAVYEYGIPLTINGTGHSVGFNNTSKTQLIGLSYGYRF